MVCNLASALEQPPQVVWDLSYAEIEGLMSAKARGKPGPRRMTRSQQRRADRDKELRRRVFGS